MDLQKIRELHRMNLPEGYLPAPDMHLRNERDNVHFQWTMRQLQPEYHRKVLDVGCFDGWLDFLLMDAGFRMRGVEFMPDLAAAAQKYADRNFYNYKVYTGAFQEVQIQETFDAVICYETLEHIPLEQVPAFIEKLEYFVDDCVLISLPDQQHEENAQHQWTPTEALIRKWWETRAGFSIEYQNYKHPNIPSNWFISYSVGIKKAKS